MKSPTYSMTVVELPAVDTLELEYVFPAYTGLPPQKVEVGGDVAALARHRSAREDHVDDDDDAGGALAAGSAATSAPRRCSPTAR